MNFNNIIDNIMTRFGFCLNKYRFTTISIICHNYLNSQSMSSAIKPLVICGPSGSGKSSLIEKLINEFIDCFKFSVSHTTRSPRSGETNGKQYYFVDRQTFQNMIKENKFIEFTQFSGNYYGTTSEALEEVQQSGRIPILDIEIKGVLSLKKTNFKANYVFIKPLNIEALEKNLRSRGSEDEQSLQNRLSQAIEDNKLSEKGVFDLVIVNDDLEIAYKQLKQFITDDIKRVKTSIHSKESN